MEGYYDLAERWYMSAFDAAMEDNPDDELLEDFDDEIDDE